MKCFLSYRRADAEPVARELFLHFQVRFGRGSVFWDHESIPPDSDWQKILRRDVEATDVVIALIGPSWLQILNDRLKSPSPDYVRFELEHAHTCNKPVVIVPLVGGTVPRASDLPDSLRFLTRQQSPRLDLTHERQAQLENLERRLIALGPAATELALQRLLAADGLMACHPDGRRTLEEHPSWWDQWIFHAPERVQRLMQIIRRDGQDSNVVVITGRHGSGRRYLTEAATLAVARQGSPILYLQLDLDGYETSEHGVLRRFLQHQATRQAIDSGRELDHLLATLESRFHSAADSLDMCSVCGLLLDMTRSFRQVERFLSHHLDSARAGGAPSLFTGVLRELSQGQPLVVHAVDQASLVCTLQEDLLFLASRLPRMVLVFSGFEGQSGREVTRGHACVELEVPFLERVEVAGMLTARFGPHRVPDWLVDWLWRACQGNWGKLALLLQGLMRADVIDAFSTEHWRLNEGGESAAVLKGSFAEVVLRPVQRLYAQEPTLQRVLQTAALCGEIVPLQLICRFLECPEETIDRLTDLVDDHLLETGESPLLRDMHYSHPGLSSTLVYQFLSPLVPEMLLGAVTAENRGKTTRKLLAFLEQQLPATTRGAASLFLNLCRHLQRFPIGLPTRYNKE
jgi:hypothetical protein